MSSADLAGPALAALRSLSPFQLTFLQKLPKAELHAHLNGSIPIGTLQELARERASTAVSNDANTSSLPEEVLAGITRLQQGVVLNEIHDFFGLFPAIYALTSTPEALSLATRAVLTSFLEPPSPPDVNATDELSTLITSNGGSPQAAYLELRSTPRETPAMTRLKYIETVLDEVEKYPADKAALIVSLDRRMSDEVAHECIECAVKLKKAGRRVVGVDLCGDPLAGNMEEFEKHFKAAKEAGLGVTLHIAETTQNTVSDTNKLLSFNPDRLGHATFLIDTQVDAICASRKPGIEICLSSNLLCKTVQSLEDHHIAHYLKCDHPIAICTDDILPFRNSLVGEYALLMAPAPLGLGLGEEAIERIAAMGMECRFKS
ncbi:adenosine deaminase-like protein [Panus rudis PR-1116 ss-1]|nr:adenosine deaminase-like protein [Panus rudis PR-1116 ss-1]